MGVEVRERGGAAELAGITGVEAAIGVGVAPVDVGARAGLDSLAVEERRGVGEGAGRIVSEVELVADRRVVQRDGARAGHRPDEQMRARSERSRDHERHASEEPRFHCRACGCGGVDRVPQTDLDPQRAACGNAAPRDDVGDLDGADPGWRRGKRTCEHESFERRSRIARRAEPDSSLVAVDLVPEEAARTPCPAVCVLDARRSGVRPIQAVTGQHGLRGNRPGDRKSRGAGHEAIQCRPTYRANARRRAPAIPWGSGTK